jgi:2-methylfumaryl-CoA isomerase
MGNALFGAFGRDFFTRDGRRMMIIAITPRQWTGLLQALEIEAPVAALEAELSVSFAREEGVRFEHRRRLFPLVEAAVASRAFDDLAARFDQRDVCWGPYQTVHEAITADPKFAGNPILASVEHPDGGRYLTPGPAPTFSAAQRAGPPRAPRLGEHTDEILANVLGLSSAEIGRLHDAKLVAGPAAP